MVATFMTLLLSAGVTGVAAAPAVPSSRQWRAVHGYLADICECTFGDIFTETAYISTIFIPPPQIRALRPARPTLTPTRYLLPPPAPPLYTGHTAQ